MLEFSLNHFFKTLVLKIKIPALCLNKSFLHSLVLPSVLLQFFKHRIALRARKISMSPG